MTSRPEETQAYAAYKQAHADLKRAQDAAKQALAAWEQVRTDWIVYRWDPADPALEDLIAYGPIRRPTSRDSDTT